ncbi:MAG TPA: hypothetical protein VHP38_06920 [Ruminiclostridium sp.]|nr:hypothetical protein [Ruminiclostridium sp.]
MAAFGFFSGIVTAISNFWTGTEAPSGCYKLMSVQNMDGNMVNFVIMPTTYFVNHVMVNIGDPITGFYDANAPAPLIYPPQYIAVVIAKASENQNVKVDFFDSQLVSSDGTLKLNISPLTQIIQENGQAFTGNPANKNLVVIYGIAKMGNPFQIVPYRIIVLCTLMYS